MTISHRSHNHIALPKGCKIRVDDFQLLPVDIALSYTGVEQAYDISSKLGYGAPNILLCSREEMFIGRRIADSIVAPLTVVALHHFPNGWWCVGNLSEALSFVGSTGA